MDVKISNIIEQKGPVFEYEKKVWGFCWQPKTEPLATF